MQKWFLRGGGTMICLVLGVLANGGCGSISPARLHDIQFVQERDFRGDEFATYNACRAALEAMSYSFVRGSRAAGTLEMTSRVQPGSALLARQRRAVLEIKPLDGGGCVVRIGFWEASEDTSPAGTVTASNRLLRSGVIYDAFWERLATQINLPAASPATPAS
jgi:hypothetical protein